MTSELPDFSQYCEATCIKLWGEPDKRTKKELRWNGGDAYGGRTYTIGKHVWYDHGAERGGSTLEAIAYSKSLPNEKLTGRKFIDMWLALHELGVGADPPPEKKKAGGKLPIRACFDYPDENSVLLFQVIRFDTEISEQRFRQRQPDGKGGYIWSIKGVRRVLYRLPELIAAVKAGALVLVTEGERDANTAVALGYAATTMPGGVKKWRSEYNEFLRGADIVIVADNDAPGKDHAAKLTKQLVKVAAHVRTIMFDVKDLSEWVDAGGTREQLHALITAASEHTPEQEPPGEQVPPDEGEATAAEIEITRLAKLTALEYEQQRKPAAEKLGFRASGLDRIVEDERKRLGLGGLGDQKQGHVLTFSEPDDWKEPVAGAALLDGIAEAIGSHVVMVDHCRDACALWVLHTYLIDRFLISPRLGIRSPTKRCGKTTLLDVLDRLVARSLPTANVTPAAVFRVIEQHRPTLLIDEADTFLYDNDELRGILNGNRKGAAVLRTVGEDYEPRAFSVFTAVAIALIGALPDTLHDRSVTIELKRRQANEPITPFRPDRADHLDVLARKIARWVKDNGRRVGDTDPGMPPGIINRAADNWRPLLAIADVAGGKWPERARATVRAAQATAGDEESRLEQLLEDIRRAFAKNGTKVRDMFGAEKIELSSADLVKVLVATEGRPWAEMGKSGKPITQNKIARMLKPLGIAPSMIGPETKRLSGYKLNQFEEAFERYLPLEAVSNLTSSQQAAKSSTYDNLEPHSQEDGCEVGKCEKSNNDGLLCGCEVAKGEPGGLSANRHHELVEWRDKWIADGLKPEDVDDALRTVIREEVADPAQVEPEVARVLAASGSKKD
jgi:Protein of unknown function (DUF3631)